MNGIWQQPPPPRSPNVMRYGGMYHELPASPVLIPRHVAEQIAEDQRAVAREEWKAHARAETQRHQASSRHFDERWRRAASPPKRGTVGEMLATLPDLREAHPLSRLSDQSIKRSRRPRRREDVVP